MQHRSFSSLIAVSCAIAIFVPFKLTQAQIKNNLLPASSSTLKTSAATPRSDQSTTRSSNTAPATDVAAGLDSAKIKEMSDRDLDGVFDSMVSHYSKDAVIFNNIGASYYGRKMYDKAESALHHAIALNNHPAFLTNLSIVYETKGQKDLAMTMAQRAIAQSPRYARARSQLCELMLDAKRDADTVLCFEEMSKFTQLDPLDQTYYAVVLVRSHNLDKAIGVLAPLVQGSQKTALMFNTLGNAYYYKKKYSQAAEAFKQGVEIDPDSAQLRFNLAVSLTAVNNRDGALSQYGLMKDKDPKLAEQLYRYLYRDKIIFVDEQTTSKKQ